MIDKSLLNRLKTIKKFTGKGFLLHGSTKKLDVLLPFKPSDHRLYIGNLKAVYASDAFSFSAMKASLASSRACGICYLYICKPDSFTEVSKHHFVSFGPVTPIYMVAFSRSEVRKSISGAGRAAKKGPDEFLDFFCAAGNKYLKKANAFLRKSELHGWPHAMSSGAFAAILSQAECPSLVKEAVIGAVFHDIGRDNEREGAVHAASGADKAAVIIKEYRKLKDRDKIIKAIKYHRDGKTSKDKLIGCIWDADRLDMLRMYRKIDLSLLTTPTAKKIAAHLNSILEDQLKKHPSL